MIVFIEQVPDRRNRCLPDADIGGVGWCGGRRAAVAAGRLAGRRDRASDGSEVARLPVESEVEGRRLLEHLVELVGVAELDEVL